MQFVRDLASDLQAARRGAVATTEKFAEWEARLSELVLNVSCRTGRPGTLAIYKND